MFDSAHVGQRVQALRQHAKLSQAELGERCGFSAPQTRISKIERGRQPMMTMETVEKLAEALGVTPEDLTDGVSTDAALGIAANGNTYKARPLSATARELKADPAQAAERRRILSTARLISETPSTITVDLTYSSDQARLLIRECAQLAVRQDLPDATLKSIRNIIAQMQSLVLD